MAKVPTTYQLNSTNMPARNVIKRLTNSGTNEIEHCANIYHNANIFGEQKVEFIPSIKGLWYGIGDGYLNYIVKKKEQENSKAYNTLNSYKEYHENFNKNKLKNREFYLPKTDYYIEEIYLGNETVRLNNRILSIITYSDAIKFFNSFCVKPSACVNFKDGKLNLYGDINWVKATRNVNGIEFLIEKVPEYSRELTSFQTDKIQSLFSEYYEKKVREIRSLERISGYNLIDNPSLSNLDNSFNVEILSILPDSFKLYWLKDIITGMGVIWVPEVILERNVFHSIDLVKDPAKMKAKTE